MSRITLKDIREGIKYWNDSHPAIPMTYSASTGYVAIGILGESGSMETIVSGSTAREAWEKFCAWKNGFYSGCKWLSDITGMGKEK